MTTPPRSRGEPIRSARRLLDPDSQALACGRSVDDILGQVADGHAEQRDDHQQHCPHCQAALAEFTTLWAPVHESAHELVTAPSNLRSAVMAKVNRLIQDVWYTLQLTDGGAIRIAARIVATIARDTARRVPGVRVALGRSTQSKIAALVERATRAHRYPNAAVGVLGRTAVIDLAIAVTYGDQVDHVAREVQRQVMHQLRDVIALQTVTVNVTVDDLLPPKH